MKDPRVINAIIFGIIFMALAPFFGGLIWSGFIVKDAISQTGHSFNASHLNLIYVTVIMAYKHVFFPTLFVGLFGGWWRASYNKFSACFLFGLFAALVLAVYKYVEYVVVQTPVMEAKPSQYIQLILVAYALPAFIISTFIAFIAKGKLSKD